MSFLKNKHLLVAIGIFILIIISGFKILSDRFVIGFQHPESAYMYNNYIFVSNIGSSPTSQNLDGFITKLDRYGNILEYKFIDNLKAPKGLYVYNKYLYIADLDRVCIVELDTKRRRCITIKNAKFLNDVIYVDGNIFVTDTKNSSIYKIDSNNNVSLFFRKDSLSPNGITFSKKLNAFLVVSFNKPEIYEIALDGILIDSYTFPDYKGFDGIMVYKDKIFISDYFLKNIFETDFSFKAIHTVKDFKSPVADIFVGKNHILAPLIEDNKLYIGEIEQ